MTVYYPILMNFAGATVSLQNVSPIIEPGNTGDNTTVDVCVLISASGPIDQLVVTFNTAAGTAGTLVIIKCFETPLHSGMQNTAG